MQFAVACTRSRHDFHVPTLKDGFSYFTKAKTVQQPSISACGRTYLASFNGFRFTSIHISGVSASVQYSDLFRHSV